MQELAVKNSLQLYLSEIDTYPLLSREKEYELAKVYYDDGDLNAANSLIVSNLRFVVKIASEYVKYGFHALDLIQEGTLGLMRAVKKFNPYKGYRLISYAVWWIKSQIHNYIMKFWSQIKIGTTQAERKLFQRISKAKIELGINDDKLSKRDVKKIANHFGVKEKDVKDMEIRMASRDYSLDQSQGEDSISPINILSGKYESQEDLIIADENRELSNKGIKKGFDKLSDREKEIIRGRFFASPTVTLKQLGYKYRISKERVRQIEAGALKKLRFEVTKLTNSKEKLSASLHYREEI